MPGFLQDNDDAAGIPQFGPTAACCCEMRAGMRPSWSVLFQASLR
jgi:hypothetical protein